MVVMAFPLLPPVLRIGGLFWWCWLFSLLPPGSASASAPGLYPRATHAPRAPTRSRLHASRNLRAHRPRHAPRSAFTRPATFTRLLPSSWPPSAAHGAAGLRPAAPCLFCNFPFLRFFPFLSFFALVFSPFAFLFNLACTLFSLSAMLPFPLVLCPSLACLSLNL